MPVSELGSWWWWRRRRRAASAVAVVLQLLGACGAALASSPAAASSPSAPASASAAVRERSWPFPRAALHPALHLVGDSTMADKPDPPEQHPERGWGQMLRAFLREPARLVNHAANGRSTKRFVDEGRWAHLLTQLEAGDVVLIQFGHNDQKADDPRRYAAADTDFKTYLRGFVADARGRGATAVLATPVSRRKFDAAGRIENTLGRYPAALREVAAELGVPLVDLNALTARHLEALGPEASKAEFMWIEPGRWSGVPQGRRDDTHYVERGARAVAALAVQALRAQVPALGDWFR